MPRFTSQEAKEKWLASCAATRAAKQGAKKVAVLATGKNSFQKGGGLTGERGSRLNEIDAMIDLLNKVRMNTIETEQAMQSARELLSR